MAKEKKYEVNYGNYIAPNFDAPVLIEAAARYLNAADYPDIDVMSAILGIEESPVNEEV